MIGYIILAHDDPHALRRLVLRLDGAPVVAHIDASVDLNDFDAAARLESIPGFEYVRRRVPVNWGGYSVVAATVSAIQQSLALVEPSDRLVFLSGRCYPIRPVRDFEAHLYEAPWSVHARAYAADSVGGWHADRYRRRHAFDRSARFGPPRSTRRRIGRRLVTTWHRLRDRPIQTSLRVAVGSQWMAIPRECAEEAVEALEDTTYSFLRDSFAPDEMAIQTFVHNSRWASHTEFGLEAVDNPKVSSLPNFHLLDSAMTGHIESSRVLHPQSREFFVRKVDSVQDARLLQQIDAQCGWERDDRL